MASRVPLIVGAALLVLGAVGAVVMLLLQTPARSLEAAFAELRGADSKSQVEKARGKIEKLPPDPTLKPILIAALRDSNDDVRAAATDKLDEVGLTAKELLEASTSGRGAGLRAYVESRLDSLSSKDEELVPGFIEGLDDQNDAIKQRAIRALGNIGAPSKPAVPKLTTLLREGDLISAGNAAETLGKIGPDAAEAIPALLTIVREGSKVTVIRPAILALSQMGDAGQSAIPILLEKLPESPAIAESLTALSKLKVKPDDLAPFIEMLQESIAAETLAPEDFAAVVQSLGHLGERAKPLLPNLFSNAPRHTTGDVVAALRQIDPEAGAALEAACAIEAQPAGARERARDACFKINGRSLLFIPFPMQFDQAREWCEERGGRLASIRSAEEQRKIIEYARRFERSRIWFGLSDRRQEGVFQWEDGSPFGDYANWMGGEPNNSGGDEDHGEIYLDTGDGVWNDSPGWAQHPFFIQWID